jgi:hypothetical protein
MGLKFCEKCYEKVEQYVMECPECQTTSFVHKDPTKTAAQLELEEKAREQLRSMTPGERKIAGPEPDQGAEVAQLRLSQLEKAMGPEKLDAFRKRLQKELLELEYLEWRSMQPGWKSPEMEQRWKNISSTAAGVAIGSSMINSQIRSLRDEISDGGGDSDGGDSDGGDSDRGIMDWFNDAFN